MFAAMRWLALALILGSATAVADTTTSGPRGRQSFDPAVTYKVPRGGSPSEGPADAPVTIVVWSDYACSHCNRVQPTLDQLARLYPGQLRLVHRALPLDDDDVVAFEAALAANAQGAFRPMHDRLYAAYGHVDRQAVELIARELGLDMARFRADLDTHAGKASIAADIDDARAIGVSGTPTFFINGRPVHGNQPLSVFAQTVDEALARAAEVAKGKPADLYDAVVADGHVHADVPPDVSNETPELDMHTAYRVGLGLPGHQLGADDAPVTIIEWSDFACPFCAKEAPVIAHIHEKYGDSVKIVYRHLPLHRASDLAAEAAVAAAAQGKFWPFHDKLFASFGHLTRGDLEDAAKAAGLDMAVFRKALDERRYRDEVKAEEASARAEGVDGTPTTFVDGHPIGGAQSAESFDTLIDIELKRARAAMAAGVASRDMYPLEMSDATGSERADPAAIPGPSSLHMEPTAIDRERSVAAACRRRDGAKAKALAVGLDETRRRRMTDMCAGQGVDL